MPDKELKEEIEMRPYPNEHACRLRDPGAFSPNSFRRTTRSHEGKQYSVIMGKLKGETNMTEQAYRYNKQTWTAAQARTHCSSHDGSFEAAQRDDAEDMKKADIQKEKDREVRSFSLEDAEVRIDDTDKKPKLVGYAAKYGKEADLGFFKEKIKAGAFDGVLGSSDARALKNHDPNLLLGRESSGTLRLESNSVGLRFEIDVPDTTTGKDTVEEIRRGDLSGCSFAFKVAEDEWKHFDEGPSERTIIRIDNLYDIGPVTYPAYQDTSVAVRSLETDKGKEKMPETVKPDVIDDARKKTIDMGYRKAQRIHNRCITEIERIKSAKV